MKFKSKILKSLLLVNIAFLSLGSQSAFANTNDRQANVAQNSEALTRNQNFTDQARQLQLAVDDEVNVVNSNAYFNYASQDVKAEYESAIAEAKSVLARLDTASYDELRNAMNRINLAKRNIKAEVNNKAQNENKKNQLRAAIQRNQTTLAAAKQLKQIMPNYVKKFDKQLNALIARSENLIARANKILSTL
ncbi:hypothetical protein [Anaerococcus sp. mt242]|uniref:hypothetical protein n=1 Tax=unclassified Anaerococcus TaxID=2614126 RepID=UPI001932E55F|nr:hypothetical protein [Anaerococcus sp. mt242]MBM0045642.1 hypothetical protein [Anaerococcus sp. mt242]